MAIPPRPPGPRPEPVRQHRRGWLAGLLALFFAGLGHVYAGQLRTGLIVLVVSLLLPAVVLVPWLYTDLDIFVGVIISGVVSILFWAIQLVWAVQLARHTIVEYPRPLQLRILGYLAFVALSAASAELVQTHGLRAHVVEVYAMSSESMLPNLLPGDQLLVDKLGSRAKAPRRGDIVVFRHPQNGESYVKRLLARGGSSVEALGARVRIGGELLQQEPCLPARRGCLVETSQDMAQYRIQVIGEQGAAGSTEVPEDHLYVLGDNRNNSWDSRQFGAVAGDLYEGVVTGVLFSYSEDDGMRWDRMAARF